jgi:hypothetical protein
METDCKYVTEMAKVPLEALDDCVLSVMRGHVDAMERAAQDNFWARRR